MRATPRTPQHATPAPPNTPPAPADYIVNCGGTHDMVDGWYTKTEYASRSRVTYDLGEFYL